MFIASQADMLLVLNAHNCPMIMILNCLMFDDWDKAGVTYLSLWRCRDWSMDQNSYVLSYSLIRFRYYDD